MSQILAMAKQLQDAEQTIAELRRAAYEAAPNALHHSYAPTETEPVQSREVSRQFSGPVEDNPRSHPGSAVSSPEEVLPDLSLDRDGKICFYGPTSAVHDPPASGTPLPQASNYEKYARALLAARASEARVWEGFALGRAAIQSDISRQVIAKLLSIHWTWTSPMFMWVYRPAFTCEFLLGKQFMAGLISTDDMSTGGPYYLEFLLIVLCAHAARFCDLRIADRLISTARLRLGNAIHQPSSIPTVQALLQLSARDLAFGSISQAWLYSGMAFRMASDLGLHHSDPADPSLKDLNPVDIEVRRRLFWSCYFWDK